MLTEYLDAAIRQARYEILPDDGQFYGEIPGCQGVWAAGETLEACRSELREVLEEWIFFRVHGHLDIPEIAGLRLVIKEASV